MQIRKVSVGRLETICYILGLNNEALIIDPGDEPKKISRFINAVGLRPIAILLTHGHWDHFGAAENLKKIYSIDLYVHPEDRKSVEEPSSCAFKDYPWLEVFAAKPTKELEEGIMKIGSFNFEVIHTPGHTKGSCCFYFEKEKVIFTGDTLFKSGIGRTDLSCSEPDKMHLSLKKLSRLPDDVVVYPGHGPETTIGTEKSFNVFLDF
ncbi:MAG: MBL fold metallo-hydrolase [Actinobacteria bacterium]|nr:MBL fold metallo-hydrolase [Actinomycetota bacterium]